MTIEQAFVDVPASTEKTALIADFDALYAQIATTKAAGAFSELVQIQLQSEVVNLAEAIAAEWIVNA